MGLFDALGEAFSNDATLGERQGAGLTKKVEQFTITWQGPKPNNPFQQQPTATSTVVAGQSLSDVAKATGVPIEYSCMKGTCRVCDVVVDGERLPACTAKVAARDMVIEYGVPRPRKGRVVPTAVGRGGTDEDEEAEAEESAAPALSFEEQLRAQLAAEMAEEAASKKKGGWPFG